MNGTETITRVHGQHVRMINGHLNKVKNVGMLPKYTIWKAYGLRLPLTRNLEMQITEEKSVILKINDEIKPSLYKKTLTPLIPKDAVYTKSNTIAVNEEEKFKKVMVYFMQNRVIKIKGKLFLEKEELKLKIVEAPDAPALVDTTIDCPFSYILV